MRELIERHPDEMRVPRRRDCRDADTGANPALVATSFAATGIVSTRQSADRWQFRQRLGDALLRVLVVDELAVHE